VLFDGVGAPLAYTTRGEVAAVVPYEIAGRASTVVVVEYQGRRSEPVSIPVLPSNPSLFTQNRMGTGEAGVLNDTGCCNSVENPAVRGTWATVYATGEGLLRGRVRTGSVSAYRKPEDYPQPVLPVRLTVGGAAAELNFVAAAPHAVAGLLQINFRVPKNAPVGDAVPLVLTVGDASSSPAATMAVRDAKNRVLLATSREQAERVWRAALVKAGYDVFTARDGEAAIEVARAQRLDLAVVDLPGSGADLQSCARAMRGVRPNLKLIVAVDGMAPAALQSADLLGAQAVMARPVGSVALVARVRELTRRRTFVYDAGTAWPLPRRPR
jgi:uncharacterized protein (TIGR03437 family)